MWVRREIIYTPTMYPNLQLHLTEVQDLDISRGAVDNDHYNGIIEPQDEMAANHRLWWEVSISSQYANNILRTRDRQSQIVRTRQGPVQNLMNCLLVFQAFGEHEMRRSYRQRRTQTSP